VEQRKLRAIRPLMLMPKGTIYFSEIFSDEANLYTNSIKCPIGKKAYNSGYCPVSVIQEAPRHSGPPVQMSCFALMVWTRGSSIPNSMWNTYQPSHTTKVNVHVDLFPFEVAPTKMGKIVDHVLRAVEINVSGMKRG
jgi:hypothetical protein